jgi:hypothetical protein
MSASVLDLHEWVDAFRDGVSAQLAEIHPSARCICREYFGEMHMAVEAADMAELARLVKLTQDRIADELFWEEQKRRAAADPRYVVRHGRDDP